MAGATQIGAIHVISSIDTGKYVEGAKKLQSETKKTEAVVKSSFSSMGTAIKGFGGAMAAGLSVGLLGGLAKRALDFAAAIGTTAKQLGVTTKELQEFRYAADQVGIKNAEADRGLEKLGVTLGKAAAGSKTAQAALGAVGVKLSDIQNKTRVEIFGQIADQMIKQGGAAKNAAAANAIFGESASKLTPLLDQGSKGINQLSQAAERLGIVLSDEQIQKADQTAQKLDDVKTVLSAQIAGVVADNADSIVSLANALGQLTSAVINFLGSNPQAALAILGAMAGSRFGLPGAAAGAIAGAALGNRVAQGAADANMDPRFRAQQIRRAQADLAKARAAGSAAGRAVPGVGTPITKSVADAQKELARQNALGQQALAAARRGGSTSGTAAIPQFLARGDGGGRSRRGRAGPRDRSDDVLFQFEQEQRRADMDILRAKMDLAHDYVERTAISIQMLDLEKEGFEAELKDRVRRAQRDFAEGKITATALQEVEAQAETLKARNDEADALKRQAVLADETAQWLEENLQITQQFLDRKREELEGQLGLAETASERRAISLRILELDKRAEKAALEKVIADETASRAAKLDAEARLAALDSKYNTAAANVMQQTRGPYEDYLASLPSTAAKAQEALERLQVQGLEGLTDAVLALADGLDAAKDTLLRTLRDFFLGMARLELQKGLASILPQGGLGNLFGAFNGGIGGGTTAGQITVTNANLPMFASGGSLRIWGNAGQDRNIVSLNGIPIARADYGERLTFENDNGRSMRGGGRGDVTMYVNTPDADSFRRSEGQITRHLRRRLG